MFKWFNRKTATPTDHSVIRLFGYSVISPIRLFGNSVIRATRKGFTLIELLVVIGIMGLLGTASVGGYRAMQRGMAERGVMESVNSFIRAAYQRAQIDRQPVVVYFWNETIREATDDFNEIVVGRAVAVRRHGRITKVNGNFLYDEFADLNLTYQTDDEEGAGGDDSNTMFIYPVDSLSQSEGGFLRTTVRGKVLKKTITPLYLSSADGTLQSGGQGANQPASGNANSGEIETYVFQMVDAGGVTWQAGMAYGFEFAELELPHNYIFGLNYSTSAGQPVQEAGTLVFDVGYNEGNGMSSGTQGGLGSRSTILVSSLRPGEGGTLTAKSVGQSGDPTGSLK